MFLPPMTFLLYSGVLYFLTEVYRAIALRSRNKQAENRDRKSFRLLWVVILLTMFLAGTFASLGWGETRCLQPYLYYSGVFLFVIGFLLRALAIRQLNTFFTVNVEIQKDHQLINTGLYAYMRHPSYTGALLMFYGMAFAFYNYLSYAVILVCVTAVFLYRISIEEEALKEVFGKAYEEYASRVKRLIPGIY